MALRMFSHALVLALAARVHAQSTPEVVGATPSSGQTLPSTSTMYNLDDYWNMYVGPVTLAATTTTVAATSVPSSSLVPPPPLYYAPFPSGAVNPAMSANASWKFPSDFMWGVASAAYQAEGAVRDEGRGPSIWDVLSHRVPNFVMDNNTGDVGDNHYYMYKEDIARIAALGMPAYSFSISWSRIYPFGKGQVNEAGLKHYDDVIDTCLQYGIQPIVTLYHWDLPLALQNAYGGWLSEDIVGDFLDYAKTCFERWGSKVSHWATVNEPIVFCDTYPLPDGYFKSTTIPAKQQPYYCGQHVILAHAAAYRAGKSINSSFQIAFKNNGGYKIPLTSSSADAQAVSRAWDFNEGWFSDPIYLTGDYPATLKAYTSTFLPNFTAAQMQQIKGSADFYAHDAYTSQFYYAPDGGIDACTTNSSNSLYPGCFNSSYTYASGWDVGPAADVGSPWLHKATDWVPTFLAYIQMRWKPKGGILVSEFGFSEPYEQLKPLLQDICTDPIRSSYFHDYMQAILIAISQGTNVIGAIAWSIFDNLEWQEGYNTKFGLQYVNISSPGRERAYKASMFYFVDAFKQYGLGMASGTGSESMLPSVPASGSMAASPSTPTMSSSMSMSPSPSTPAMSSTASM